MSCYFPRRNGKKSITDQKESINTQITKFVNDMKKESDKESTGVCHDEIKKAIHLLNESKKYLCK